MSNNIFIKQIGKEELGSLQQISRNTFYSAFASQNTEENMKLYMDQAFSTESLLLELNDPESWFYFALLNDEVVGYLKLNSGTAQSDLQDENGMEISRIYIEEKYQGHRIGQHLIDKALEIAKHKKSSFIWLGVWEKNVGAIRFYERNGFEKFSTHHFMLGHDLQADIIMKKKLNLL